MYEQKEMSNSEVRAKCLQRLNPSAALSRQQREREKHQASTRQMLARLLLERSSFLFCPTSHTSHQLEYLLLSLFTTHE